MRAGRGRSATWRSLNCPMWGLPLSLRETLREREGPIAKRWEGEGLSPGDAEADHRHVVDAPSAGAEPVEARIERLQERLDGRAVDLDQCLEQTPATEQPAG